MPKNTEPHLPLWQRLAITVAAIFVISFLFGVLWKWLFAFAVPGYLAGVVGGLVALPVWEFLKRVRPKG